MKKTTLIFGSCLLADDYIRQNEIDGNYKYISKYEDICGYTNCDIVMLFGSWKHSARDEIDEYCKSHNIKQRFAE